MPCGPSQDGADEPQRQRRGPRRRTEPPDGSRQAVRGGRRRAAHPACRRCLGPGGRRGAGRHAPRRHPRSKGWPERGSCTTGRPDAGPLGGMESAALEARARSCSWSPRTCRGSRRRCSSSSWRGSTRRRARRGRGGDRPRFATDAGGLSPRRARRRRAGCWTPVSDARRASWTRCDPSPAARRLAALTRAAIRSATSTSRPTWSAPRDPRRAHGRRPGPGG